MNDMGELQHNIGPRIPEFNIDYYKNIDETDQIICMFCEEDMAGRLYYKVGEKNICTLCLRKLNAILRIV